MCEDPLEQLYDVTRTMEREELHALRQAYMHEARVVRGQLNEAISSTDLDTSDTPDRLAVKLEDLIRALALIHAVAVQRFAQ